MKKILFALVVFLFPISFRVLALTVDSKSLVAMDMDSGRVFYEINPDEKRINCFDDEDNDGDFSY